MNLDYEFDMCNQRKKQYMMQERKTEENRQIYLKEKLRQNVVNKAYQKEWDRSMPSKRTYTVDK